MHRLPSYCKKKTCQLSGQKLADAHSFLLTNKTEIINLFRDKEHLPGDDFRCTRSPVAKQFDRIMQLEHNQKWRNTDLSKEDQINSVQEKLDKILLSNKAKLDSNTQKVDGGRNYLGQSRLKFEEQLLKALRAPLHSSRTDSLFKKKDNVLMLTVSGLDRQKFGRLPRSLENSMDTQDQHSAGISGKSQKILSSPRGSNPRLGTLLTEVPSSSAAFRVRSLSPRSEENLLQIQVPSSDARTARKAIKLKLDKSLVGASNLASVHQSSTMASITSVSGSKQVTPQSQKPGAPTLKKYSESQTTRGLVTHRNSGASMQTDPPSKMMKLLERISSRADPGSSKTLKYYQDSVTSRLGTPKTEKMSKILQVADQPLVGRRRGILPQISVTKLGPQEQTWDSPTLELLYSNAATPVHSPKATNRLRL